MVQNDEQFTLDRFDGFAVRRINGVRVDVERRCNARVASEAPPALGEIVRVRSRRYLVEAVDPAEPGTADQSLVRLSCLEDDAEGEELTVLWERELDARRMNEADWSKLAAGQFDPPRWFAAYYNTLRWNAVTSTDPKLFQAPYRAGIKVDAYQLEPLRKALLLPRVNLFIADDVGLGKTIEAGLIVRELLMRQRVRRIVVAAPCGYREVDTAVDRHALEDLRCSTALFGTP